MSRTVTLSTRSQRSLRRRLADAWRSYWRGPVNLKDPELNRLFGVNPPAAGFYVSEEGALGLTAAWNATTQISQYVAMLPCILYRRQGESKAREPSHPLYRVLHDAPNPEMSAYTFRQLQQTALLLYGNAYAEIVRDAVDRVAALWPLHPERVTPERDRSTGRLRYRVRNPGAADEMLDPGDMFHLAAYTEDGIVGRSPVRVAREALGLSMACERFGGSFFANGTAFGGVLSADQDLDRETADGIRAEIERMHRGADRAHRFLVVGVGLKYQALTFSPEDSQFLQTRKFQVEEVARIFNIPPHKIKNLDRATFSNIEHQALEFFQDTLLPWLKLWESEINRKLLRGSRDLFVEHSAEGVLRGDAEGRAKFYSILRYAGIVTANECRRLENLNPLPGGDELIVPKAGQAPALPSARDSRMEDEGADEWRNR